MDIADHAANFTGRRRGALGQFADFIGHNGKAASTFARPRRLNRGIECQQVGLLGHVVDRWLGTGSSFALALLGLGLVLAGYLLWRQITQLEAETARDTE